MLNDYVNHGVSHPNGSVAHQMWAQDRCLHVAVAYNNPYRWKARQALFNDFRRHMAMLPNVKLYVGELAYGERPFEVTSRDNPLDFQWRTREVLWHKENILNQVIARFDRDWQYGAYVDGDINFARVDVALETIQQLQLHEWCQMFSAITDLDPEHQPLRSLKGFAYCFCNPTYRDQFAAVSNGKISADKVKLAQKEEVGGMEGSYVSLTDVKGKTSRGMTGGCWAFRRSAFEACGGLLDTCILGAGDWHMAYGLIQEKTKHLEDACEAAYRNSIQVWQQRAACIRKNIGYTPVLASHYWHGSRRRRGYGWRWQILKEHNFDPQRDIYRDANGIYQLHPDRIAFRDDVRAYFKSRNEDDLQLMESDTHLAR